MVPAASRRPSAGPGGALPRGAAHPRALEISDEGKALRSLFEGLEHREGRGLKRNDMIRYL